MKFQYFDLGRLRRGAVVVVKLSGSAANVRLMDVSIHGLAPVGNVATLRPARVATGDRPGRG